MNKKFLVMGILAGLGVLSTSANAVTVSKDGADYTVSVAPVAGFTYDFTYTADFTAFNNANQTNISGINFKIAGGPGLVSAEVRNAPVNAADATADPTDYWNVLLNDNLSGADLGCEGSKGGDGFVCSGIQLVQSGNWIPPTLPNDPAAGPIYEWIIRVTFAAALTEALVTQETNPIRAQFVRWECKEAAGPSGNRNKLKPASPAPQVCGWKGAGLMSEAGPFEYDDDDDSGGDDDVPEPGTLALLGLGLLGLWTTHSRRRLVSSR